MIPRKDYVSVRGLRGILQKVHVRETVTRDDGVSFVKVIAMRRDATKSENW